MENSLEICNGCGKVPRSLDLSLGSFSCSRCGHNQTIQVNSDEYERVIFNLEQAFHQKIIKEKLEYAMSIPIRRKVAKPKKDGSSKVKKSSPKRRPINNKRSSKKRK
ncbi:MAG: hypothetical protein ACP5N9_05505 [Candidatus Bilamarchaeum sp.]|jgi:hypothetical protein